MQKVQTEYLEERQARLTVTVEPEILQREMKAAATRIARKVNVPGFRKGKTPYPLIVRYFGEEAIFDEALQSLGQNIYKEALDESGLTPYAPGSLDDFSRDPLVLTYNVPLPPEVNLGAYRDVRIPFEIEPVTDEDVAREINRMVEQQGKHEPVERPVEMEDVAVLDIKGVFVGDVPETTTTESGDDTEAQENAQIFLERTAVRVLIAPHATYPVPGFPAEIVGMSAGDERSFDITLPAESEDIADTILGKTIHFAVTCSEVLRRELPVLDDEFARSLGDYESLDDLKDRLRKDMEHTSEHASRDSYLNKIFNALLADTVTLSFPPIMVEERIDVLVRDFDSQLQRMGMNAQDYLKLKKSSVEEVRNDFRETAIEQVKRGLVLSELAQIEKLGIADEEIDNEIQTRLLSFGANAASAQPLFSSPQMRHVLASQLLTNKALERLVQIARGDAPPVEEDTPPTPADTLEEPPTTTT